MSSNTLNLTSQNKTNLSLHLEEVAKGAALCVAEMLVAASAEATAGGLSTAEKSSFHDLVTKYDQESERMITDYILAHHSDSTIVGEEYGARGGGNVQWYVDPIDGTSNFAAGLPFFCVSIGAAIEGQILAGAIYDPIRQEMFSATTQGAYLNGQPIRAQGGKSDAQALLLTAFPSPHAGVLDEDVKLYFEIVRRFATVRRMGSAALALAYVACGRADIVYEPGINPWDVAAGSFLVQQAGGRYIGFGKQRLESESPQPWMFARCIAACPEFELEQSILSQLSLPF
jgi:myo-inositol-1(or 4)-monophosphatase